MKLLVRGVSSASRRQPSSPGEPGSRRCVSHTEAFDTTALRAWTASGTPCALGVLGFRLTPAALPPDLCSSLLQARPAVAQLQS